MKRRHLLTALALLPVAARAQENLKGQVPKTAEDVIAVLKAEAAIWSPRLGPLASVIDTKLDALREAGSVSDWVIKGDNRRLDVAFALKPGGGYVYVELRSVK